jgi:DNA-binding MarR family transcriptional regulator
MTLDYLYVPVGVLKLGDLNLRQKLLLGLIISFDGEQGLKVGNEELSVLLDVWPSRVSRLLKSLEEKGYVRIENPQSRHRVVHLLQSAKVDDALLATKRTSKTGALATLSTPTVAQSSNINKRTETLSNKERVRSHFQKPTSAEVSEYAQSIGYALDGAYFCDRYEAGGWLVGRSPMKDWKAVVRTWRAREGKGNENTRAVRAGSQA